MSRRKKMEVSAKDYALIKKNYEKANRKYFEHFTGSRKTLSNEKNEPICTFVSSNSLDLGNLSKQNFFSFLGLFNKNLYRSFLENPNLIEMSIDFKGLSRKKSRKNFDALNEGEFFYNLDLNNAYWQIAHQLGYIDDKFYFKYKDNDDYKTVKRLCISFLSRQNRKMYFMPDGDFFTITCDTSVLQQVYKNIRNTLYLIFSELSEETNYFAFNIDSIYIGKNDLQYVKQSLHELHLDFKLTLCQKISSTEYSFGKKIRKF